ncbi:MAG: 30S ribosomal protein S17 [Omnitrophica WOR_2 bacterium GWF2_38_59]|nr:MAG: 30S ribosomal protein S17 [Omnitrophica WOR_2 bacterium GWA2_37_7]OGX25233.1 MAG: 30S ribosomal protein S17 [Omnitrophica WOR_2 bacterium GWF2_38_59]OGX47905.1 MAG: 30S ribosomal protein S17 [Omnitrophica WOR_2 bacterium RIFOXYA2_FULL_38_17]OGX54159.1 MAG: 30S ribosomal protein S17 [Omnitrophica WOR_2 bacterium RIFOXYA12_FULL_38_10]OGX56242.1 MAG: 30S ribosomal protein S17 [Omnitrophica WOR_2 bacterium RIFOXYC2_FULL_38_12]OGX60253.1 MAG: 30S ribosomal protein S17 [Omnitrophica WOR_2 ba
MSETAKRQNRRKFLQGIVTSDKMNKTRVVQVKWATKHSKYNKVVRAASKYKAHDEKNESKTGDVVQIMETRPLSKDKRWIICSIVKQVGAEQEA